MTTANISESSHLSSDKSDFTAKARQAAETRRLAATPRVIAPVEKETIPAADNRTNHYRVIGNGGYPARIVDGSGNVLLEATPDFSIHAVSEAPDGAHLLVNSYPMGLIIDPVSKKKISLPECPPGNKKLGFGSWDWIDDNTVLGVSGDAALVREAGVKGKTIMSRRHAFYMT